MEYIKTKDVAEALDLSSQTIRRAAKSLGIRERSQGKSFAFSPSEASAIAHFLRDRVSDPRKVAVFDASVAEVASDVSKYVENMTPHQDVASVASKPDASVAEVASNASVMLTHDAYVALVAQASLAEARKEIIDEKEKTAALLRETIVVRDDEISALREEVSGLKKQMSMLKTKRLSVAERLFGRLLLPPSKDGL